MDHAEEAVGKLVVAGGDGAVDLEMAEHALVPIALFVERAIILDLHAAVGSPRNDGLDLSFGKNGTDDIGIIAFLRKEGFRRLLRQVDQIIISPAICGLAARQVESDWSSKRISQTVKFTGKPAPGAAKSASMCPPFSARCRDVGANGGAVDAIVAAVCHDLGQRHGNALPNSRLTPSPEPPIDDVPAAIFGRHVAPRCAATEPPENAVDDRTVLARAACLLRLDGQQALQNAPFGFGEIASAQACLQKAALNQSYGHTSITLI